MFYHIFYPLRELWFGFNVFRYITFRTAFAAISAFIICVALGPIIIRLLSFLEIGEKTYRPHAPTLDKFHGNKSGTPTMGGVLVITAILISTLLWARWDNAYIWLVLGVTLGLGVVGFMDDFIKLSGRDGGGLRVKTKFTGQLIMGAVVALFLYFSSGASTLLHFPFFKKLIIDLGIFYLPFVIIVIVGSSNAVNLTDGLDGLAIGCVIMIAAAYSAMCYVTGHFAVSDYLGIPFIPQAGEVTVFCASILGGGLGFLWFNSHPASIFMGDTGSLALGGAIGTVAVLIKKEVLLLFVGGVFVIEALSVILQVASFKLKGKRIFLMAPLHHHYQLKGWPEPKITIRFWIISAILALFALATLKLR
ncbi:MAG: phospho-N-acetylmuramoyl-pentapeptide-transferase [Candidatus Omnitrophica bacterium]|nr:phospho-N-acetylmuramoyl-pentapeptide-transferase [Candidatus Omnitrophota bacterium]